MVDETITQKAEVGAKAPQNSLPVNCFLFTNIVNSESRGVRK